jgi:Down syndrome cell adhesion protein
VSHYGVYIALICQKAVRILPPFLTVPGRDITSNISMFTAPRVPAQDDLLLINATSVTLFLETWPSGGCPLQYFVVEYRARGQKTWTLVSNNIQQEEMVIPDLTPATWYAVRIAAYNDAGSSVQEFVFATKTRTGGSY